MSVYDVLGAPSKTAQPEHVFTLPRMVRVNAATAAPTAQANLTGVTEVTISGISFKMQKELPMHGSGWQKRRLRQDPEVTGNLIIYRGYLKSVLDQIFGVDSATYFGSYLANKLDIPEIHLHEVVRDYDNKTIIDTMVYPNLRIDPVPVAHPIDSSLVTIPWKSDCIPFAIKAGYEVVYDQFATDGSTVEFTLSSTAVPIADCTYEDQAGFQTIDELALVLLKPSGSDEGYKVDAGFTFGTNKLTFTTAPAASGVLKVLYIKAL